MDGIQDADTLADQLLAKNVITGNVWKKVHRCYISRKKNRVLMKGVKMVVRVNPEIFQAFIDVLKMNKRNETIVSQLTGKECQLKLPHCLTWMCRVACW